MKKVIHVIMGFAVLVFCLSLFSCATAPKSQSQKEQEREATLAMANQTLQNYYAKNPGAQKDVQNAAGYAPNSEQDSIEEACPDILEGPVQRMLSRTATSSPRSATRRSRWRCIK